MFDTSQKDDDKGTQTEYDSSFSTLYRINDLIILIHKTVLGNVPENKIRGIFYLDLLDRLFMEAQSKLKKDEMTKCEQLQHEIQSLMRREGRNLYSPEKVQSSRRFPNPEFYKSWGIVMPVIRKYEIYLLQCLDNHNMLLKDAMDGMSKFRMQ